jgi:hypothetical protein
MDTYTKLVAILTKERVPCKVTISNDGSMIVECGWDYPDSVFEKITRLGESIGIPVNTLEICAESYGHSIIESARIAGGPKRYSNAPIFWNGPRR